MQLVFIPEAAKRARRRSDWGEMIRRPSAFLPIAMSLAALTIVVVHVAVFGVQRQADEGTPAHLFQLLMAAQVPFIATFAARSFSQEPLRTLAVLAIQLACALAALAPVFYFKL